MNNAEAIYARLKSAQNDVPSGTSINHRIGTGGTIDSGTAQWDSVVPQMRNVLTLQRRQGDIVTNYSVVEVKPASDGKRASYEVYDDTYRVIDAAADEVLGNIDLILNA